MRVFVLLQQFEPRPDYEHEPPEPRIMGVYARQAGLDQRIERIREANRQYPLREVGLHRWRIGPTEDEGFFGNRPVNLWGAWMEVNE